jgi:hypothetical protein
MESSLEGANPSTTYYHLVNPQASSWKKLVPVVQDYYSNRSSIQGSDIKSVPFDEWVQKLAGSASKSNGDIEVNPAVKLLDFYQGLSQGSLAVTLDTEKTKQMSESLRKLERVDPQWMKLWLEQWAF